MSGFVGVWGRLAALLVLLSVVLAVAGPSADAQADWSQLGVDIDGENEYDRSGYSVAMNAVGDTVIIGAPTSDGNGNDSGQARVFTLTDSGWVQVGANIDAENEGDEAGWSVAMNSSGYAVIIGAPYNDGNGDSSGHARVFRSAPEPTPASEAGSAAAVPYPGPFTQTPAPAGTAPNPVAASPETPTAEPAAAAAAGDGVAGLAYTGTTTTTLAYLAVGLIGFGALLVPVSRRRN